MRAQIDGAEVSLLRGRYLETGRVTSVLRLICTSHPRFGPLDLMDYLVAIFGVPRDDVRCLGGWWHDGTGELSDDAIEQRIAPRIDERRHVWEPGPAR